MRVRAVSRVLWVVVLLAVASSCGVDAGRTSTPTGDGPPSPGTTFGGRDLPPPATELARLGDLVAYLAPGPDDRPQLVAVDPATASVAWTYDVAVPDQPHGVPLGLDGDGRVVWVLRHPDDTDRFEVAQVGADGEADWSAAVYSPTYAPEACGDDVCVTTASGEIVFDRATGDHRWGAQLPDGLQVIGTDDDAVLAVAPGSTTAEPAERLVGQARRSNQGRWRRPLDELYGADPVTSYAGWSTLRYADRWVAYLAHTRADGDPTFPLELQRGSVAAFTVDGGEPAWHRADTEICDDLASTEVLVLCQSTIRYASEDEVGTNLVDAFEVVDPVTGATEATFELDEPIDLFDPSSRLVALGADRWLVRDGDARRELDLASGRERSADADAIGWCPDVTDPPEVSVDGELVAYGGHTLLHPCTLDGPVGPEEAVTAEPPDGATGSVVGAGGWVVWVRSGRLQGVVPR